MLNFRSFETIGQRFEVVIHVFFFYIFVRAAMPFILLFDIFDTIISCIYILIFYFIHLYHCTVWIFIFLWHSTPAYLLYFICIVFLIFALMAETISYVCAFHMYVYIIHPFYLCYRSNWLQKREWCRACDCIGSLSYR